MIVLIGLFFVVLVLVAAFFFMGTGESSAPAPVEEEPVTAEEEMDQQQEVAEEAQGDEKEEGEVVEQKVPDNAPEVTPDKIDGLVGWYTGDSYDEKKGVWTDKSGKGNDVTEILGEPEVIEENGYKYVIGGRGDGLRFPVSVMTTGRKFTMIHVARYTSTSPESTGRIFDGYGGGANYLSGYHTGWRNRNYFGGSHRSNSGWIATNDMGFSDDTVDRFNVSVDQKHMFRWNGLHRSGHVTYPRAKVPTQMTINYGDYTNTANGNHQSSEWACAEVLFYNSELDLDAIKKLENYLFKKYNIPKLVRTYTRAYSNWIYEKDMGWSRSLQASDDAEKHFLSMADMGSDCGVDGALSRTFHHRHGAGAKHSIYGPREDGKVPQNGRHEQYSWCLGGLLQGSLGEEKQTQYVSINDNKDWTGKWKTLNDINCRGQPIIGFDYEVKGDRMRTNYKCSAAPVDEDSCREITAHRHGNRNENDARNPDGGLLSSIETQDLNCGSSQVLTSMSYDTDDAGNVLYKGKCCSLADM
jgi:hypothetical protein